MKKTVPAKKKRRTRARPKKPVTDLRIELVEQLSDTAEQLHRAIHAARTHASDIELRGGSAERWWRLWSQLDLAQALAGTLVHARPQQAAEAA